MDRKIKILFLAANPTDTDKLRLDEEIRGIKQSLRQAEFREKFDLEQEWAVRVTELQGYLLYHKPDIVHFSGHGSEASEIILENNHGDSQTVPARALTKLFSVLKDNIQCVILNACYSKKQAQAIAKHIDCVIGMSKAIGDVAAISFAVAFYQALAYGKDVQTAFELGRVQIGMENLNEENTPKLLALNSDPKQVIFAQKSPISKSQAKEISAKKKTPQVKSIEFLKILAKQQLSKEAREQVKNAIDILKIAGIATITLGQEKAPKIRIKLLTPVNTAVRLPFSFRWHIDYDDIKLNEQNQLKIRLSVFDEASPHDKMFQQEITNQEYLELPSDLQARLAKGQWYKWRIEVFDEKGELVETSMKRDNEIEVDVEFQIFSDEEILKTLEEMFINAASTEDEMDIALNLAKAAIFQSLLLRNDAVDEFKKAIEKKPNDTYAYERTIAILHQQGFYEEALQLRKQRTIKGIHS